MGDHKGLWQLLLKIHETAKTNNSLELIAVSEVEEEFKVYFAQDSATQLVINFSENELVTSSKTVVKCSKPFEFQLLENSHFDEKSIEFLATYLPYALLPHFAEKMDKLFVISHFAQTLDGRIASNSGDSKWIGNQENLTHAHRMRALSDAIGVGTGTLKADQPSLNVRHVEGEDPIKVIIGGPSQDPTAGMLTEKETLFVNQQSLKIENGLKRTNGLCDVKEILSFLKKRKIMTFYLEGGAITSSLFLKENCIDQVQIHIAPKILGSGKIGFHFEGIDTMSESIQFKTHKFLPMGNQVMFIGEL